MNSKVHGLCPRASVIIPAYNAEKYILSCIESALNQTEQNIEIIVVNDNSTDTTVSLIQTITDPRVQIIHHTKNEGPGKSRNDAICKARGTWLVFLDADDWMSPTRIQTLCDYAEIKNLDMIADNNYLVEESRVTKKTLFHYLGIRNTHVLIKGEYHVLYTPAIHPIVRSMFLEENKLNFQEHIRCGEDFYLWVQMYVHGARVHFYKEALYFYRTHAQSITYNKNTTIRSMILVCDFILSEKKILRLLLLRDAVIRKKNELQNKSHIIETWRKGTSIKKVMTVVPVARWITIKYWRKYFKR